MPCDYRILQSPLKGQVLLVLLETVGRSHLETLKQIDNCFASRASASKFRCIMSAVGTILLQSPGWNEGKARYETLGIHERKVILSSFRSGTITRAFVLCRCGSWLCIRWESAAPTGLKKMYINA